jgi:hypothetical protein
MICHRKTRYILASTAIIKFKAETLVLRIGQFGQFIQSRVTSNSVNEASNNSILIKSSVTQREKQKINRKQGNMERVLASCRNYFIFFHIFIILVFMPKKSDAQVERVNTFHILQPMRKGPSNFV